MKFLSGFAAVVLLSIGFVWPQTKYPPTLKFPVTFYDFHTDGGNPEFQIDPESNAGIHLGMVAATLDTQSKPILGPTPYYNCQIAKWFRPYTSGDFTIPNYTNPPTTTCSNPLGTVNYDTAFKNIVIQDTLPFTLVADSSGTYEYTNSNFFPLDGRGFGNEVSQGKPRTHNYSFSMEMHWKFMYKKGLTFNFEGDDLWVFINGRLAIDFGGIHGALATSINLDTFPGLTVGKTYSFDVFYAQRHVPGSDIRITTNVAITSLPPDVWGVRLEMIPWKDTIVVGDSVVLRADVINDTDGFSPNIASKSEWLMAPEGTSSSLRTTKGSENMFYANSPNQMFTIYAKNNDSTLPIDRNYRFVDSIKIYVISALASNRIGRTSIPGAMEKSKAVREFYNLRGQKLQGISASHVDGIVLERTIDQDGKVLVKRSIGSTSP